MKLEVCLLWSLMAASWRFIYRQIKWLAFYQPNHTITTIDPNRAKFVDIHCSICCNNIVEKVHAIIDYIRLHLFNLTNTVFFLLFFFSMLHLRHVTQVTMIYYHFELCSSLPHIFLKPKTVRFWLFGAGLKRNNCLIRSNRIEIDENDERNRMRDIWFALENRQIESRCFIVDFVFLVQCHIFPRITCHPNLFHCHSLLPYVDHNWLRISYSSPCTKYFLQSNTVWNYALFDRKMHLKRLFWLFCDTF